MAPTALKTFVQPNSVYQLDYPGHWDAIVEKEGESCGFGPHERDDVGLWISIMQFSVDAEKIEDDLPMLMQQALAETDATNLRRDPNVRHFGLIADMTKEDQGGHYWIVTGGDVVLFASSQVPVAERETWNPLFEKVMASLRITRDQELLYRRVASETLTLLREQHPEQEFKFEENEIRGRDRVVYLSNLFREVQDAPERREQKVKRFVEALSQQVSAQFGSETWDDARSLILPVLKPKSYIDPHTATGSILTREWLADVLVCYAISNNKTLRFVTAWDVGRWGTTNEELEEIALANLAATSWPKRMPGSRNRDDGHVIIVDTDDSLASSRLLHPELHRLFSKPLGTTFWAGIPCRNRLVLYSDRRKTKQRIDRQIRRDHDGSAYAITPSPFLVTRDGIAPGK